VGGIILFGVAEAKDDLAAEAHDPDGIAQQGIRAIREEIGDATALLADLCMDEYTSHGHCGVIVDHRGTKDVDNDQTLELLVRQSLSFAEAGAHFVAPSDMMDGRVGAIRDALDDHGFSDVGIIAYSAKFASGFYGPFREAAESAPQFGDRRSYQMDPANSREAMSEIALDVEEGADMVMVKPALPYLDIIREARDSFELPIVAYNVSGEYSMVKAAAEKGWIDGTRVRDEVLMGIKRAGADLIITYFALEYAEDYKKRKA
jgi:porphobilinogen synthase